MKTHDLRCWPEFFNAVAQGLKGFELRRDDRNFQQGDQLTLQEFVPDKSGMGEGTYTGNELDCSINYVLRNHPHNPQAVPGLERGYCILSITPQHLRIE